MSRTLYLGKTKSGKTTLMNNHLQDFVNKFVKTGKRRMAIVLLSPTAPLQNKLFWMQKYTIMYRDDIDENVSAEVYDACKKNYRENELNNKKKVQKPPIELFIIVDDLGENSFQKYNKKCNAFKMLATNLAHYKNCHLIWLLQRMAQAAVTLRSNSDFVYCFRLENLDEKKNFHKWFCGDLERIDFNRLAIKAWGTPSDIKKFGYIFIDRNNPNEPKKYYANKELLEF